MGCSCLPSVTAQLHNRPPVLFVVIFSMILSSSFVWRLTTPATLGKLLLHIRFPSGVILHIVLGHHCFLSPPVSSVWLLRCLRAFPLVFVSAIRFHLRWLTSFGLSLKFCCPPGAVLVISPESSNTSKCSSLHWPVFCSVPFQFIIQ